ncbi:hypothetical protein GCM10029964_115240 [Kibdelosporangium lantanae]
MAFVQALAAEGAQVDQERVERQQVLVVGELPGHPVDQQLPQGGEPGSGFGWEFVDGGCVPGFDPGRATDPASVR